MSPTYRLVLGADQAGADYKNLLVALMSKDARVSEVIDIGVPDSKDETPYPSVAIKAGQMIVNGEADRAILVCGTGLGVAISANKVGSSAPSPAL